MTEIYDYLRLLFARAGIPHCPVCGREVERQSAQEIVDGVAALPEGSRLLILAPVVRGAQGHLPGGLRRDPQGRVCPRAGGREGLQPGRRDQPGPLQDPHDRSGGRPAGAQPSGNRRRTDGCTDSRLTDSVETALKVGEGYLTVQDLTTDPPQDLFFSEHLACPEHGSALPEIEPRTFSFNTPHGACPDCQGLGSKLEIDPDLLIPDTDRSLREGAIVALEWSGPREEGGYYWQTLEAVADHYHIDLDAPVRDVPKEKLEMILYGTSGER